MKHKEEIISKISIDKPKVERLWEKALLSYRQSKETSVKNKKLKYNYEQRGYRNKIMDIAMKTYNIQDPTTKKDEWVSSSFSEFWDYLHWWLNGTLSDGAKKWNEMEDYHHNLMNKFPEELEKEVKKWNKKHK